MEPKNLDTEQTLSSNVWNLGLEGRTMQFFSAFKPLAWFPFLMFTKGWLHVKTIRKVFPKGNNAQTS